MPRWSRISTVRDWRPPARDPPGPGSGAARRSRRPRRPTPARLRASARSDLLRRSPPRARSWLEHRGDEVVEPLSAISGHGGLARHDPVREVAGGRVLEDQLVASVGEDLPLDDDLALERFRG